MPLGKVEYPSYFKNLSSKLEISPFIKHSILHFDQNYKS